MYGERYCLSRGQASIFSAAEALERCWKGAAVFTGTT